jgi:hypothetical protein
MSHKINDGLTIRERYCQRHRRKGLCVDCRRPVAPGRTRCAMHLKRARDRYAKLSPNAKKAKAAARKRRKRELKTQQS